MGNRQHETLPKNGDSGWTIPIFGGFSGAIVALWAKVEVLSLVRGLLVVQVFGIKSLNARLNDGCSELRKILGRGLKIPPN